MKNSISMYEFKNQIKSAWERSFPGSMIYNSYDSNKKSMLYNNMILQCYIADSIENEQSKILFNDIIDLMIIIGPSTSRQFEKGKVAGTFDWNITDSEDISNMDITIEFHRSFYELNGDNKKMGFRKFSGSPNKAIDKLDLYFSKLRDMLKEDYKNSNIKNEYDRKNLERLFGKK